MDVDSGEGAGAVPAVPADAPATGTDADHATQNGTSLAPLPTVVSSSLSSTNSRLPSLTEQYHTQTARIDALQQVIERAIVTKRRRLLGQLWSANAGSSGGGAGMYDEAGKGAGGEVRRSHLRLFLTHHVRTAEEEITVGAPAPAPAPTSSTAAPIGSGAAAALAAVGVNTANAVNAVNANPGAPRGKTLTRKARKWTVILEGLPLVGQLDVSSAREFDRRIADEEEERRRTTTKTSVVEEEEAEGGRAQVASTPEKTTSATPSPSPEKTGLAKERVVRYTDPDEVPSAGSAAKPLVFAHCFDRVECTFRTVRKRAVVLALAREAPGGAGGAGGSAADPSAASDSSAAAAAAAATAARANKSRRQIEMEERAAREAASTAAKKRAAEVAAKRKADGAAARAAKLETAADLVLGDITTLTWSRSGTGDDDNRAFHFTYTDTPTAPYTDADTLPDLTDGDRVVCTLILHRRSGAEHRYVPSKKLCRELFPPLVRDLDKCPWLLDEPWEHTDAAKDERLAKERAEAEARAVAEAAQKRLDDERRLVEERRAAVENEKRRAAEEKARIKAEKAAARAAKKAADAMKTPAKRGRKKAEPGTRKIRCGECLACTRDDCGQCKYCLDKPKFGGAHRMKKPCQLRQCTNPKVISFGGGGGVSPSPGPTPGPSPPVPAASPAMVPGNPLLPSGAGSIATTDTASSAMPAATSFGATAFSGTSGGAPGLPAGFASPMTFPQPSFPPPPPQQLQAQQLPQMQAQPPIEQPQAQSPAAAPSASALVVPPSGMPMVLPPVPPPGGAMAVAAQGLMTALKKTKDKIPKKKKAKAKIKISAKQVMAAASRGSSPTIDESSPAAIVAATELAAAQEAARKEEERRMKAEEEARKREEAIKKLNPYHPPLENDIIMPPTLTRSEALRAIFLYIKDNRLQDVSDLSTINNDAKLEDLFGCKRMQFSQVNSLLLSRKLLLPANPTDPTNKKADAPIKFVYVMSADGADVSTMVDLEEDPLLLLGEDYAPTMMSCDVDVNLPGMFQERTRELMRRIKAREYEYNSARNRALKALLPSGSNKVDEDIVKEAIDDTVNGRGLSASTNLPVLLALSREAPEGSEVGIQCAADARIADIMERLEQKVQAAQACRDIVEACKSGSL